MDSAGYPPAEAVYEDLVQNASLFYEKVDKFRSSLGIRFRSRSLDGTCPNLHQLFVEVTSRGGIDKVVRDRKWKEVISALKLPETSTNWSFILRKNYMSQLYRFEEVYYFRKSGQITGSSHQISGNQLAVKSNEEVHEESAINHSPASPNLQSGTSVVGLIDGKFDSGYVVSVDLGFGKLNGILYHVSDESPPSSWILSPCIQQHQERKEPEE